jgi:hypothetical protein
VTAKGNFLDGLPVFAGDAKTEAMLQQILKYFGPDPEKGLILDGTVGHLVVPPALYRVAMRAGKDGGRALRLWRAAGPCGVGCAGGTC